MPVTVHDCGSLVWSAYGDTGWQQLWRGAVVIQESWEGKVHPTLKCQRLLLQVRAQCPTLKDIEG